MITHHPADDVGSPDNSEGPAGSAVFDSVADTVRYVQRVVRRILAESELAATAHLFAPEVPAAGNGVLIAVLALIVATAALAVAVRTRRHPGRGPWVV